MARHHLLGIGCGQSNGSAEILLKAAFQSAEESGAAVEMVRLDELRLPSGPDLGAADDSWWLWDRIVGCDGLIVSTPIISRTVAARLKLLADRLLGPNADAAIISELAAVKRAGGDPVVPFRIDERVLKPRIGGFIAVGGSLTSQWKTLTLPIMHTITFSMHIAVVDQVTFEGAGTPRSIVVNSAALERATRLGHNVAEQMGRTFEEAEYRGDEPGLCPMCHLNVVVLMGRELECATCGASGWLGPDLTVEWTDLRRSVISMDEKRAHYAEIRETAQRQAGQREEIEARAEAYDRYDRTIRPRTPS